MDWILCVRALRKEYAWDDSVIHRGNHLSSKEDCKMAYTIGKCFPSARDRDNGVAQLQYRIEQALTLYATHLSVADCLDQSIDQFAHLLPWVEIQNCFGSVGHFKRHKQFSCVSAQYVLFQ